MDNPGAYDAIVIGAGGVGSAALWQLASRGQRVLGIDRHRPPHSLGSSHGQTRIIRQAYFEHPNYTPLLLEVYGLWQQLSELADRQLYNQVGVLQIGPAEGEVIRGVKLSAETHGLSIEQLSAEEITRRWPVLRVPQEMVGVLEPRAGYLLVEDCVQTQLDAATHLGAELLTDVEVLSWEPGPPVRVRTDAGEFQADRLVITAGAWAGTLLRELGLELEVRRKSLFWYAPEATMQPAYEHIPCFLYELPHGVFYGMSQVDERGVKLAEHSGGSIVEDPAAVDRNVDPDDAERLQAFSQQYLQGLATTDEVHQVCMYTMSGDEHFVVDRHPQHPHVAFAAGLSGHGFKFTPILGKALADLLLDGRTDLPIEFLGLR